MSRAGPPCHNIPFTGNIARRTMSAALPAVGLSDGPGKMVGVREDSVKRILRALIAASLVGAGLAASNGAGAQEYPTRPVRVVLPLPPGGSGDTLARLLGQKMTEDLEQTVVIDNRPGGNMMVAASVVAKAPPDGYTLLLTLDIAMTMNQSLFKALPYNPEVDFAPISLLSHQPLLFVANPKFPASSMKQLADYAKANPGKVNYGSGAIVGQLAGELLKSINGAQMVYVAYKGSGPALQALISDEIDLVIADITPFVPYINDGKLKPIAVSGPQRDPSLPQVPTVSEQGFPGLVSEDWFALYAPAGTPKPIIAKLNKAATKALTSPDVRGRLLSVGINPATSTPEELAARQKLDATSWGKVIRDADIHLD